MALRLYTKEWLEELCSESFSYREVLRKAGRKPAGGSQATLKKKIEEKLKGVAAETKIKSTTKKKKKKKK